MDHPTPKLFVRIFIILMILLGLTVIAAHIDFDKFLPGNGWSLVVAMTIAIIKGVLIVLYFMHVKYGKRLNWAVAFVGFVWLGIMLTLTFSEYLTRNSPANLNYRGEPRYLLTPSDAEK